MSVRRVCAGITPRRRSTASHTTTTTDNERDALLEDSGDEAEAYDDLDDGEAEEDAALAAALEENSKLFASGKAGANAAGAKSSTADPTLTSKGSLSHQYTKVFRAFDGAGNDLAEDFRDGFQVREDKLLDRNAQNANRDAQRRRRKRAHTLTKGFMEKIDQANIKDLAMMDDLASQHTDDEESMPATPRSSMVMRDEAEKLALEESIKMMQEQAFEDLADEEKIILDEQCETIATLSHDLLVAQDHKLTNARVECKKVTPLLRKRIIKVQAELKSKLREDFTGKSRSRGLFARRATSTTNGASLTPEQKKSQEDYHKTVQQLEKEIAILQQHLSQLRTEKRFPKMMQWKLRVDTGSGTFIGVRDLEVGKIRANYHLRTDETASNQIVLQVTKIDALVGLLEFAIRGTNAKGKILGGLLTPTINRLDLEVEGDWTLVLRYSPGSGRHGQARWEEVKDRSNFNLKIKRTVTGLSTMRLPTGLIQKLSTFLLPELISSALRAALPVEIGIQLATHETAISLEGRVNIKGDMSPKIWREPLAYNTAYAEQARRALQISQQDAVALDYLCRGRRAAKAGFKAKPMSLARLFKWRLRYATYPVSTLEPMLELVQLDCNTPLPDGWLSQLVRVVSVLAKKPLNVNISASQVHADLDAIAAINTGLDIYRSKFEARRNMARAQQARALADRELNEAMQQIQRIRRAMDLFIPRIAPGVKVVVNGIVVGGLETGRVALSLQKVDAKMKLPRRFNYSTVLAAQTSDVPLQIQLEAGPRDDEYTIRISSRDKETRGEEDSGSADSEITLRNACLEVCPPGAPIGAVHLKATEVKAELQLTTLDRLLSDVPDSPLEGSSQGAAGLLLSDSFGLKSPEAIELVRRSEEVMGQFREASLPESAETDDYDTHKGRDGLEAVTLPDLLAKDEFDLRLALLSVQTELVKQERKSGSSTLQLHVSPDGDASKCVELHARFNMRDMFDEFL